ncbi:MAG: cytochrome B [Candidatus Muproteobacteria bacterium RBG_16_62_13]|uniref:Cytochrome b n=1 Tax=Candidatus Muproteobacteria bacterium RBG_16_62_13 TaxID=1817756 RepID=A0A1F6T0D0_9PROT|nr:MAG: cytochrome B [Candidatus Muproteobacteria bacterium RBG_16_62_13]
MNKLLTWIDDRFPLTKVWREHLSEYYAPKNFNFWYFFGSLALLVLVIQIVSGIFLTMHYKPDASLNAAGVPVAFASVEYIMRDVPWGWLIRYIHSTGASAFFIVVYLHMYRGLLYGSYRGPRELLWLIGVAIFVALMAEAFMGYLLPWGNMSYWGAQVIISLFDAIPWIGPTLSEWIRGDFVVADATLNRFFAFHVIAVPLILVILVFLHIVALHKVGSNNPDGIEIKKKKGADGKPLDGIPFHPYYTVKDIVGTVVFLILFAAVIFFSPELGGWFLEHDNFVQASALNTPTEIVPLWYFTPFYSILRANIYNFLWVDAKIWGVFFMFLSIALFAFLPWLDKSPVKSIRYRGWMYKTALAIFVVSFIILGYLGTKNPEQVDLILLPNVHWAGICTLIYFLFFFLMPIYTRLDKTKPVPERVTDK